MTEEKPDASTTEAFKAFLRKMGSWAWLLIKIIAVILLLAALAFAPDLKNVAPSWLKDLFFYGALMYFAAQFVEQQINRVLQSQQDLARAIESQSEDIHSLSWQIREVQNDIDSIYKVIRRPDLG